jgi:hypothetical protein
MMSIRTSQPLTAAFGPFLFPCYPVVEILNKLRCCKVEGDEGEDYAEMLKLRGLEDGAYYVGLG